MNSHVKENIAMAIEQLDHRRLHGKLTYYHSKRALCEGSNFINSNFIVIKVF